MKIQNKTNAGFVLGLALVAMMALSPGLTLVYAQTSSNSVPDDHLITSLTAGITSKSNLDTKSEASINEYVNGYTTDQKDHNWGMDQNIKNVIVVHNFNVVANMKYADVYAFIFDVQNQKQHSTYNPTIQEAKLYEYFVKKYPNPVIPTNVTPGMIKQVVQSWRDAVNSGNVPYDLFMAEPAFWATTAGNAYCLHFNKCTPEEAKRGFDLISVGGNQPVNLATNGLPVTPFTLTKHYVNHVLYVNVSPINGDCTQSTTCFFSNTQSGIGILTINLPPTSDPHSSDPTVVSYSYDHTTDSHGTSVILSLQSTTYVGNSQHTVGPQIGYGSDTINDSVTTTCGGNNQCGVYGVSTTAQSAYYQG